MHKNTDFEKLIESPDVYVAAVALSKRDFFIGRGDRNTFFELILKLDPRQIPDLGNKLKLVTSAKFMSLDLFNDPLCNPSRVC